MRSWPMAQHRNNSGSEDKYKYFHRSCPRLAPCLWWHSACNIYFKSFVSMLSQTRAWFKTTQQILLFSTHTLTYTHSTNPAIYNLYMILYSCVLTIMSQLSSRVRFCYSPFHLCFFNPHILTSMLVLTNIPLTKYYQKFYKNRQFIAL